MEACFQVFRSRDSSEAQRVGDDGNGGQRHGRPRDHGREQEAEHRIKDARRDWDADHVEQEREGEIMPDIAHRVVRRLPRTDPGTETAMRERDATFRAFVWLRLPDFRVHGAGPDCLKCGKILIVLLIRLLHAVSLE